VIQDFYSRLFPQGAGLRCLAVFTKGLKKPPEHFFYKTDAELILAATVFDKHKHNVYHGCAVYTTDGNRKGDNVAAIKSVWVDLDVGPGKPYQSKKDAATALETFRVTLGLPAPSIVDSGNGVHAYFHFERPIAPANWDRVSAALAACMDEFGVMHDTSRTEDKASILRVPTTGNYKSNPAKQVTLKRTGDEIAVGAFYQKLKDYAEAKGMLLPGTKVKAGGPTNKMMTKDYPPSESHILVEHCPILKEIDETGGDVGYEVWWRAIGVAKHLVEPEETAAHWTRNRTATGHDKADWQKVMEEWQYGPTSCSQFSKHSPKCSSCPKFGKITSPIVLGHPEVPPMVHQPAENLIVRQKRYPHIQKGAWEFGAKWLKDATAQVCRIGVDGMGRITRSQKMEDDGTFKHYPFCDRWWQVMRRVRNHDGVWQLEIGYAEYNGFKTFMIDSAAVMSPDSLRKEFSAREIHIYGGTKAMEKTQDMIRFNQDLLYDEEIETKVYPTLGWTTVVPTVRSPVTDEFVIGNTVLAPKPAKPSEAMLGDTVTDSVRYAFQSAGTSDEWIRLVNYIYNRPGAEAYQFLICSALASPLVSLTPGDGEWHGIPIVVTGDSGAAKTTTCLVAMSVYGNSQALKFSAGQGQGDTVNAMSVKLGSLRHLPCILDEMSGLEPEKIQEIFTMIANGKMKDRMNTQGQLVHNPYFWDMIPLVNTNDKLHEVLEGLRSGHSVKAMQLRSFEVQLLKNDLTAVFKGVNKTMVEVDLLANNHGVVGRDWLQFVVNNRKVIADKLGEQRKAYMIDPTDESNIRFYKDLIVTVKVAAMLARSKGIIQWDVSKMIKWAEGQLVGLRDSVTEVDWPSTISDFIASFHGRTIVSKHMKMGPGRRAASAAEMPLEPLSTSALPVARKAIEDKRFVFTVASMKEWCRLRKVLFSALLQEMRTRGYFSSDDVDANGLPIVTALNLNIGSGTTVSRPQAPCYQLNWDKVAYEDSEDTVDTSNVVQLHPVTETVTVGAEDVGDIAASP
jgi:hypothetical protein